MDLLYNDVEEEGVHETPNDFSKFLEFTNALNIPLNEEYFNELKARRLENKQNKGALGQSLSVFDQGIKNGRYLSSEYENERRLQNALWRVWWRQTRARFHASIKEIPDGKNIVEEAIPEVRTLRIRGVDIGDFPTEYVIPALLPHEIPVVGTYVDPKIVPGLAYRVRRNGTDDYLFDGAALVLKSVGKGYGKRLTFHSEATENDNFFWSDSNEEGFSFSIQVIFEGDKFNVLDRQGRRVAEATLTAVGNEQEIEKISLRKGYLSVVVSVEMECTLNFSTLEHVPEHLGGQTVDLPASGMALCQKDSKCWKVETVEIRNVHIPDLGACSFQSVFLTE